MGLKSGCEGYRSGLVCVLGVLGVLPSLGSRRTRGIDWNGECLAATFTPEMLSHPDRLDKNRLTLALPLWAPSWTSPPGDDIGWSPLPEFHHSCGVWGRYAGSRVPLAEDRQAPSTDKEFGPLSPTRPPIWFYCPQSRWFSGSDLGASLGVRCLLSPPPPCGGQAHCLMTEVAWGVAA